MSENPKGVRYIDLTRVCEHYFGSHAEVAVVIAYLRPRGLQIIVSLLTDTVITCEHATRRRHWA